MTQNYLIKRPALRAWSTCALVIFGCLLSSEVNAQPKKVFELKSGQSIVGIVIDEGDTGYLVKDSQGIVHRVKYEDIQEVNTLPSDNESRSNQPRPSNSHFVNDDIDDLDSPTRAASGRKWAITGYFGGTLIAGSPLQIRAEYDTPIWNPFSLSDQWTWTSIVGLGGGTLLIGGANRRYFAGSTRNGVAFEIETGGIFVGGYSAVYTTPGIAGKLTIGNDSQSWKGFVIDAHLGLTLLTDFYDFAALPTYNFGVGGGF
jgi:hypothetical protein